MQLHLLRIGFCPLELWCKQMFGVLYNLWACLGWMQFLRKEHWVMGDIDTYNIMCTHVQWLYLVRNESRVTCTFTIRCHWSWNELWCTVDLQACGYFSIVDTSKCFTENACNNLSCYFPIHLATFAEIFLFIKFNSCINAFLPNYMSHHVL